MSGWIYGKAHDAEWTQKFPRRSHRFQNPLRQNYKHTATLAEVLGVEADKMQSIVLFIGDAKLKTVMPKNVMVGGLIRYIKSYHDEVLSEEEVGRVLKTIETKRLTPGLRTHFAHVEHVKGIQEGKAKSGRKDFGEKSY